MKTPHPRDNHEKFAPVNRTTLPAYPHDHGHQGNEHFVMGIAPIAQENVNGKPWPVSYKIVRWHSLSAKDSTPQEKIDGWKRRSIDSIKGELAKGKLKSVSHIVTARNTEEPAIVHDRTTGK